MNGCDVQTRSSGCADCLESVVVDGLFLSDHNSIISANGMNKQDNGRCSLFIGINEHTMLYFEFISSIISNYVYISTRFDIVGCITDETVDQRLLFYRKLVGILFEEVLIKIVYHMLNLCFH